MDADAELEERRDAAVDLEGSLGRQRSSTQDLEQGALARAVHADDAERLARAELEADVLQRPLLAVPRPRGRRRAIRRGDRGRAGRSCTACRARGRRTRRPSGAAVTGGRPSRPRSAGTRASRAHSARAASDELREVRAQRGPAAVEQDLLIAEDEFVMRVQRDQEAHPTFQLARGIDDRREPEPELEQHGDRVRDVAKEDVETPSATPARARTTAAERGAAGSRARPSRGSGRGAAGREGAGRGRSRS